MTNTSLLPDLLATAVGATPIRSEWAQGIRTVSDNEGILVYDSQDAMRFGSRYYDENQVAIIHAAVAERQELPAPALPLD